MKILRTGGSPPAIGPGRDAVPDLESRFQALIRSPLRAGLLRYLHARPEHWFDVQSLMAAFDCVRLDASNCLTGLVEFGVVRRARNDAPAYSATWPTRPAAAALLRAFLDERADADAGDRSPAARRFRETIGRDEQMLVVLKRIRTAATSDTPVLIVGPEGSDAQAAARTIHELGRHAHEPFRIVRCAAMPDAPSGPGAFQLPDSSAPPSPRGTLLLDDVGGLSFSAQTVLLGALEARQPDPGTPADIRLISAATRQLDEEVRRGQFREDLYQAINAFAIRLPSLRERPTGIPVLAERFLSRYCADRGLPPGARAWSPEALARLEAYAWPGDVRELEDTVAGAAGAARGPVIDAEDLPLPASDPRSPASAGAPLPTLRDAERVHIGHVLDAVRWNKKKAARVLDISRGTLYRKIQEYALDPRGGAARVRPERTSGAFRPGLGSGA